MRWSWLVVVSLSIAGVAAADKVQQVHVGYDVAHLDLDKHVLQFKPSRAVHDA